MLVSFTIYYEWLINRKIQNNIFANDSSKWKDCFSAFKRKY